jgi:hypothetical protein
MTTVTVKSVVVFDYSLCFGCGLEGTDAEVREHDCPSPILLPLIEDSSE